MNFLLLGAHPFLDFVNTCPVVGGEAVEQLATNNDLMNLLGRLGLPDTPPLRSADPEQGAASEAREMREVFRVLLLRVRGAQPAEPRAAVVELKRANAWLARLGVPVLAPGDEGFTLTFSVTEGNALLAPLLRSALELLSSSDLNRVRKCANPECVLWYLDTTKGGTRRWCSMAICGNASKARAFRERQRVS